jgi:uncharacterized protein
MTQTAPAPSTDPCHDCGACCRSFRVSFYWAEAEERGIPAELVEQVTPHLCCMKGTNSNTPFCAALTKDHFRCTIYPSRSNTCREVDPGDPKCTRARALQGLPALDG